MAKKEISEELKALRRIEELLTVLTKAVIGSRLGEILKKKNYRTLYERTGELGIIELSKKTRFSTGKISGIWKEWEQFGIVVKEGKSYRKAL